MTELFDLSDFGLPAQPAATAQTNGHEPPAELWWGVQVQAIDPARLDAYLASVADQEQALRDSEKFVGRLVLRSQRRPDRFWLIDAWSEQYAMESASIALRTLSSVAGLVEPPREVPTAQVAVGSRLLSLPGGAARPADAPLPFFLVAEAHVKRVCVPEYLSSQDTFASELEEEEGFVTRRLLRDLRDPAHFITVDEWTSERDAFAAFERRQNAVSEITMTRFIALLSERGETDFALGVHG